jgi:hypothetical protein
MNLSDFADLQTAQVFELTTDTKQVGPGQARGYFVNTNNMWKRFRDIQDNREHPFYGVADTIIATSLDANSYFGMDETKADGQSNRAALAALLSNNIITQPEADGFIAKTLSTSKPFANTTLAQFNSAKGLFTSQTISYTAGKDIIITLNADLSERVSATTWRVETGFNPENAGRSVFVDTAHKYRIDMSGKKSGDYEIRIPLLDADFTVSLS